MSFLCFPPPKFQLNTEIPSQRKVRNFFQEEQKGNLAEECESSSERTVECREGVNKWSVPRRCSRLSSLFADQSNTRSFNAALLYHPDQIVPLDFLFSAEIPPQVGRKRKLCRIKMKQGGRSPFVHGILTASLFRVAKPTGIVLGPFIFIRGRDAARTGN